MLEEVEGLEFEAEAMPGKRVLYVDESIKNHEIGPGLYPDLFRRRIFMNRALSQLFDVVGRTDLSTLTIRCVEEAIGEGRGFDAMVTHVPPDYDLLDRGDMPTEPYKFLSALYGNSLAILRQIKQTASGIFIVAYTGALYGDEGKDSNIRRLFKEDGPLDERVAKTEDYGADYRQIEAHLKNHFGMV